MQMEIVAIGKVREAFIREGIEVYRTRLAPWHRVVMTDIPEERVPDKGSETEIRKALGKEGTRMIAAAPQGGLRVALDPGGVMLSSPDFSALMDRWELEGRGGPSFFIGGPLGLSPAVRAEADLVLSLSRMIFPHQLARLILVEQIYRATCISRRIPYHR